MEKDLAQKTNSVGERIPKERGKGGTMTLWEARREKRGCSSLKQENREKKKKRTNRTSRANESAGLLHEGGREMDGLRGSVLLAINNRPKRERERKKAGEGHGFGVST